MLSSLGSGTSGCSKSHCWLQFTRCCKGSTDPVALMLMLCSSRAARTAAAVRKLHCQLTGAALSTSTDQYRSSTIRWR